MREFAIFFADLHRLADWLDACGVDTLVKEPTEVYWTLLYGPLESRGLTVLLVNARLFENASVPKGGVPD